MREPKNQMLGTMEPPLMQLSVNVNLFIFSFFELNFIENFLWESGFSKFGQNRNDVKQKSVIWPAF